jgi:hypothetical protein
MPSQIGDMPHAKVGNFYSFQVSSSFSQPYFWSGVTGGYPIADGLVMNWATGVLSGTPKKEGRYQIIVMAVKGSQNETKIYNLNVYP